MVLAMEDDEEAPLASSGFFHVDVEVEGRALTGLGGSFALTGERERGRWGSSPVVSAGRRGNDDIGKPVGRPVVYQDLRRTAQRIVTYAQTSQCGGSVSAIYISQSRAGRGKGTRQ